MDNKGIEREQVQRGCRIENWNRVKAAVLPEFDRIKKQLPYLVELHDIPSRTLFIRKPTFPAAEVRATMSLNGDSIEVETTRHKPGDFAGTAEKHVIAIDVENQRTFYVDGGRRIGPPEIARIILQPIRDVAA